MSQVTEITEDIEIIGPGRLLSDARKARGLSVENVANKLNFRIGLITDIEADIFDKTLPSTFNRGYLKNYAKLVEVSEEDILSSYEMLGVAEKQSTEMQSFSKITEKQAQTRSLMWLSYLILAVLIGSTLVWYFQYQSGIETKSSAIEEQIEPQSSANSPADDVVVTEVAKVEEPVETSSATNAENEAPVTQAPIEDVLANDTLRESPTIAAQAQETIAEAGDVNLAESVEVIEQNLDTTTFATSAQETVESTVVFTFAGDCWVNITDATGERVAWGVKKTDYVMTIKGVAPFNVTLGKPELVTIDFAGQNVDMSQFNAGNIAKFTLPLDSQE